MSVSLILAVGGGAVLIGAAIILFLTVRSRNNPLGAFLAGLVVAAITFMAVSIPIENFSMESNNEFMLLAGFVAALAISLLASLFVVNRFFASKTASAAAGASAPRPASEKPAPRPAPASSKPSGPPPDVFISYKRDERSEVVAIARRLEALKLRVWYDAQMQSGTTFDAEIHTQVRSARAVLVCWSPGAVESQWVRSEATIGQQRGVLAAAMLKPCDLPPPFNIVHADDLTAGIGPGNPDWLRLVERVGSLVGRPGLSAFEALESNADSAAHAAWIATHKGDPLLDTAVERLKRL